MAKTTQTMVRLESKTDLMNRLADQIDLVMEQVGKKDGWQNVLTGVEITGRDPDKSFRPVREIMSDVEAEGVLMVDDAAPKIVERPAEEMTREGFNLTIKGNDALRDKVMERWKQLAIDSKYREAISWAALYGGAGIVLGVDDGTDPAKPLNVAKVKNVRFMTVLTKMELLGRSQWINRDPESPNFRLPDRYEIRPVGSNGRGTYQVVHASRVLRFIGQGAPPMRLADYQWWGDSVLNRVKNILHQRRAAYAGISGLVRNVDRVAFKMKDLAQIIAQEKGGDEQVMKRIALLATTWSSINMAVLQEDETFESLPTGSLTGLADIVDRINRRLSAATQMPHTILLSESPDGSNSTGNSTTMQWYDHIKNRQEFELRPLHTRTLDVIIASLNGGKIPQYTFEYVPLWQPTEKEIADTKKTNAETDQIYYDMGALDSEEIRGRFKGSGYSSEITLLENPNLDNAKADPADPMDPQDPQADPEDDPKTKQK